MTEFWDKKDWETQVKIRKESKSKDGVKGTKGEGINSSWMEDEYGTRVDIDRQTEIIAAARRTWLTLSNHGVVVSTLGAADEMVVSYFRRKLETDFIELCYCHNHWKTDKLWKENFSSWGGPEPKVSAFEFYPTILPQTHFQADQTPIRTKTVSFKFMSLFRPRFFIIFHSVSTKVEMPSQVQGPTPTSVPSNDLASGSSSDSDIVADPTSNTMDDPDPVDDSTSNLGNDPDPTTSAPTSTTTPTTTAPNVTTTGPEEAPPVLEKKMKGGRGTNTRKPPKVKAFRVALKETTAKYV